MNVLITFLTCRFVIKSVLSVKFLHVMFTWLYLTPGVNRNQQLVQSVLVCVIAVRVCTNTPVRTPNIARRPCILRTQ